MYAVGRNIQYYDAAAVRAVVRDAAAENYTFAALIEGIAKSVPFRLRRVPDDAQQGSAVALARPGVSAVEEAN
jgi:hypothetical protein